MSAPMEVIYSGSAWVICASCARPHKVWIARVAEKKMVDDQGRYSGPCPPPPYISADPHEYEEAEELVTTFRIAALGQLKRLLGETTATDPLSVNYAIMDAVGTGMVAIMMAREKKNAPR